MLSDDRRLKVFFECYSKIPLKVTDSQFRVSVLITALKVLAATPYSKILRMYMYGYPYGHGVKIVKS